LWGLPEAGLWLALALQGGMNVFAPETIDIVSLPSVPLQDSIALPQSPAVYFVLNDANVVLYVGRTKSLASRWKAHHRIDDFLKVPHLRIAYLVITDTSLLVDIEKALIAYFAPPLNGRYPDRSRSIETTKIMAPANDATLPLQAPVASPFDDRVALRTCGAVIRHHRVAQGLTQHGLASLVGLSRDAIYALERGRAWLGARHLLHIAHVLGIDAWQLFSPLAAAPDAALLRLLPFVSHDVQAPIEVVVRWHLSGQTFVA
jgi:transcriptional regulator with XRE-family HTH domain